MDKQQLSNFYNLIWISVITMDMAGAERAIVRMAAEITGLTAELVSNAATCILVAADKGYSELDEPAKIALRRYAELARGE